VQGSSAVSEVSSALKELDAQDDVDVIIITRGGGSFEDLLPFSDEGLVRLVASCQTPVVSAIGHEQDTPLIDLVADFRASTPTDAAKRVVPDIQEEQKAIGERSSRLLRAIMSRVERESAEIKSLASRPIMKDPKQLIAPLVEELKSWSKSLRQEMSHLIDLARGELAQGAAQLRALSPLAVLERGYAVALTQQGDLIRDINQVSSGDDFRLRLALGEIAATVRGTTEIARKKSASEK